MWQRQLSWRAEHSADCAEWCPLPTHASLLALGTYQLADNDAQQASEQRRLGCIYVFEVSEQSAQLRPASARAGPGVLDVKWSPRALGGAPALAAACADARLRLYSLAGAELRPRAEAALGGGALALAVDWAGAGAVDTRLVVSDSSGHVSVYRLPGAGAGADWALELVGRWKAHEFEAWTAAFDYFDHNVFYTGGDDGVFRAWDVRAGRAAAASARAHGAGVTAVRAHHAADHVLVTGSYDEMVRVWDRRQLARAAGAAAAGGGVWRLKWHPSRPGALLAAVMHGGARALAVPAAAGAAGAAAAAAEYRQHGSLVYGADWHAGGALVATCSFYDRELHVSRLTLPDDGGGGTL